MSDAIESEDELNRRHAEKMAKRKAARDRMLAAKTEERGLVIVHTGTGKGKSTAAFGMVMRCLGHGLSVGIVQFIKGVWDTGERHVLERFPELVTCRAMGEGFTWETQDRARDIAAARAAWDAAKTMIADPRLSSGAARRAQHRAALRLPADRRGGRAHREEPPTSTSSSPAATPSRS